MIDDVYVNTIIKIEKNWYAITRSWDNYEKGKPLHIQEKTDEEKHQINIDTIRDMYILVNANELKITPIKTIPYMTTYSILAYTLRN